MTERQKYKSIYWAWKSMKQRCYNPRCQAYHNYGARGIKVCKEWHAFEPFLDWCLSHGHQKGLELDRINNDGDYTPDNCRWTTSKINSNNKRTNTFLTVFGVRDTIRNHADKYNIPHETISNWIRVGGKKYAVDRIQDSYLNGYVKNDYGYSHKKEVQHKETGLVFNSVREAAKYFNIAPCTISNAIRDSRCTGVGTFSYDLDWRIIPYQ